MLNVHEYVDTTIRNGNRPRISTAALGATMLSLRRDYTERGMQPTVEELAHHARVQLAHQQGLPRPEDLKGA